MNVDDRIARRSIKTPRQILAEAKEIMRTPPPFGWTLLYGPRAPATDLSEELTWIRFQKAKLASTRQQAVEAIRELRASYLTARMGIRAGLVSRLIGKRAETADWAHRIDQLRRREDAAIRPYEEARSAVDELVGQVDEAAGDLELRARLSDHISGPKSAVVTIAGVVETADGPSRR